MIVYKHDNIIYFFDPQLNKIWTDASKIFEDEGIFYTENVLETAEW
jgi:hypothetical protein